MLKGYNKNNKAFAPFDVTHAKVLLKLDPRRMTQVENNQITMCEKNLAYPLAADQRTMVSVSFSPTSSCSIQIKIIIIKHGMIEYETMHAMVKKKQQQQQQQQQQ